MKRDRNGEGKMRDTEILRRISVRKDGNEIGKNEHGWDKRVGKGRKP